MFKEKCEKLFESMGSAKSMVLSTSLNNHVTSRSMSVVVIDGKFYFQSDCTFRKYEQLVKNNQAALCFENVQIEGRCKELGKPIDNAAFCEVFEKHFRGSYHSYTPLTNERLFVLEPTFIKKWIYEEGEAFEEMFDFEKKVYEKVHYIGK